MTLWIVGWLIMFGYTDRGSEKTPWWGPIILFGLWPFFMGDEIARCVRGNKHGCKCKGEETDMPSSGSTGAGTAEKAP
jgi:hypothetical protein